MNKFIKDSYLFLLLFLIIILKEPIYNLVREESVVYNTTRCKFMEDDYNKLLKFNEIDLVYESDYINTYIIYKDIYNYMNEITIKGGKDKGYDKYPVIYDNTLIGIIDRVNSNNSVVKLVTNKYLKLSVKINEEIGVLEYTNGNLIVSNINNLSEIKIGDMVYTSGLGNIKENIFIGVVKDIVVDSKNIEKKIYIDYKINIKDIDYVTVIKENK